VAWNCALAVAFLEADQRLGRPRLREQGLQILETVFERYSAPEGGLLHTDGAGGQLGDQVWALLASLRAGWSDRARQLLAHLEERYGDPELGGYFDHAGGDRLGRLDERLKPLGENSIAAIALQELGETDRARRALESVASLPRQYGLMAAVFARALDRVRRPLVKVTTRNRELAAAALAAHPYAAVELAGDERAIVCVGTVCLAPASTPEAVADAVTSRV
jgi:uncharacterized protein YyaL (SSP411 family)